MRAKRMGKSNWSTESRQARNYGPEWARKRERVLARDNHLCHCEHCRAEGRIRLATEVDHVVSRAKARRLGWTEERTEAEGNLGAINTECHKRKTQEERGKRWVSRGKIGLDGWPKAPGG